MSSKSLIGKMVLSTDGRVGGYMRGRLSRILTLIPHISKFFCDNYDIDDPFRSAVSAVAMVWKLTYNSCGLLPRHFHEATTMYKVERNLLMDCTRSTI